MNFRLRSNVRCGQPAAKEAAEKVVKCHPERGEESAFSPIPRKKRIPRATRALGMTLLEFSCNL
jgi:hypothetical protein